MDIILLWVYNHDVEVLGKPGRRGEDERHKVMSVDDFFDVVALAHKLRIADILARACTLIEERLPLVLFWAFPGDQDLSSEAFQGDCKDEVACYLYRVSRLPYQVKSSCERSIIFALVSRDLAWDDILSIESVPEYIKANGGFALRLVYQLTELIDELRPAASVSHSQRKRSIRNPALRRAAMASYYAVGWQYMAPKKTRTEYLPHARSEASHSTVLSSGIYPEALESVAA